VSQAVVIATGVRADGWHNVLAQVPKGISEMVAAAIRTIFAQPKAEWFGSARRDRYDARPAIVQVETMLRDGLVNLLAFIGFRRRAGRRSGPAAAGAAQQGSQVSHRCRRVCGWSKIRSWRTA
jgi:hypothetical protein